MSQEEQLRMVLQYCINPEMRPIRRDIFSFLIINIIEKEGELDAQDIQDQIRSSYDLMIPDYIIKQTINSLLNEQVIFNRYDKKIRKILYYINIKNKTYKDYDDIKIKYIDHYNEVISTYLENFSEIYKRKMSEEEKKLLEMDFLDVSDTIAKMSASGYILLFNNDIVDLNNITLLDWELNSTIKHNTKLFKAQKKYVNKYVIGTRDPVLIKFMQLRTLWYVITSIVPHSSEVRDELEKQLSELHLFMDTNVLISLVCPNDLFHYITKRCIDRLNEANVRLSYTDKTMDELDHVLDNLNPAVSIINRFPIDRSRLIARDSKSPFLIGFYERNFKSWDKYCEYIKNEIEINGIKLFDINDEKDINFASLQITSNKIQKHFNDIGKGIEAEHDSFLRAIVTELRNIRLTQGTLRREWILTLDMLLQSYDLGIQDRKPTESFPYYYIHMSKVMNIFECILLTQSLTDENNNEDYSNEIYKTISYYSELFTKLYKIQVNKAIINMQNLKTMEDIESTLSNYIRDIMEEK